MSSSHSVGLLERGRGFVWSRGMKVVGGRAWVRALVGVARTVWADGMGACRGMRRSAREKFEQLSRCTPWRQLSLVAAVSGDRLSRLCEWRQHNPIACVTGDWTLLSQQDF